jgi:hypothetical protein
MFAGDKESEAMSRTIGWYARMAACAAGVAGCGAAATDSTLTAPIAASNTCAAIVNNNAFASAVSYKFSPATPRGKDPTFFWISCTNGFRTGEIIAFAPYPPVVGVTTAYPPDSAALMSAAYTGPSGLWYDTQAAGSSGSITITAWNPATGVVSGHFSFTGTRSNRTDFPGASGLLSRISVAGSFSDAIRSQ